MKVLFHNSKTLSVPWPMLPFGLFFAMAYTEKAEHEVKFGDVCFIKNFHMEINNAINKFKSESLGIGIRNIDNTTGY